MRLMRLLVPALFALGTMANTEVRLDTGLLSGAVVEDGIRVFKGIPFAAPPIGELRWRAPAAVRSWTGVRDGTEFGATCMQGRRGGDAVVSEDCLFLNVWTSASEPGAKQPVMVWIHGGGLSSGASSGGVYDGTAFARSGIVLVSINYRLGALGFLAHAELSKESPNGASGNYGFLDQLAALEWVQRNIAAFGGDPDRVTIFGESAGATSVFALLASPMSKGLVHRAISQSAWVTDTNVTPLKSPGAFVASAEDLGAQWASRVAGEGGDSSLRGLRALAAEDLVGQGKGLQPVVAVDGWFMPADGRARFGAGQQLNVPLIAGSNRDEGTMFMRTGYEDRNAFAKSVTGTYGSHGKGVLALYPVESDADVGAAANQMLTDTWFLRATRTMLDGMDAVSSPAYQYHFTRASPAMPTWGAHHAAELGYVFNTLEVGFGMFAGLTGGEDPVQPTPTDRTLASAMIRYWSEFARTGNPNVEGLPEWPAYEQDSRAYLELGDSIQVGHALGAKRLDSLDEIVAGASAGD